MSSARRKLSDVLTSDADRILVFFKGVTREQSVLHIIKKENKNKKNFYNLNGVYMQVRSKVEFAFIFYPKFHDVFFSILSKSFDILDSQETEAENKK